MAIACPIDLDTRKLHDEIQLGGIGFQDVELRERFDPFRATTKESVARKFGVVGVNVYARKPN